jgi:hypothetical protein
MQRKSRAKKLSAADEALEAIRAVKAGDRAALDNLVNEEELEDDDIELELDNEAEYETEREVPAKRKMAGGARPFAR